MPITINGAGSITGISAGGLPDASVITADIADANITAAKLSGAQTGTAPIYGCRAWVNFDGTGTIGTNQTIRGSGNVSSVYKNGTGDYTVTFTTAMTDGNYAVKGSCQLNSVAASMNIDLFGSGTMVAGSFRVRCSGGNAATDFIADNPVVCLAVFR
jgi:hypothetical protein